MRGIFATEALDGFPDSLELVKQLKDDKEKEASSEYDALHDNVSDEIAEQKAAEAAPDTPPDDDVPVETPPDDTPEDTPDDTPPADSEEVDENGEVKDPEKAEKEPLEDNNGKLESVVTENMRSEYHDCVMAMEAISMQDVTDGLATGAQFVGSNMYKAAAYGARMVYDLLGYLTQLGIANAPAALRGMRKGVLYLLSRSLRGFFAMITKSADFVKRYRNSVTRTQKDIVELRKTLQEITASSLGKTLVLKQQSSNAEGLVKWLSPDIKGSPVSSVKAVSIFMNDVFKYLDGGLSHDLDSVKKLIELSSSGVRGDMTKFLNTTPISNVFFRGSLKGYGVDNELLDSYVYRQALPNNVLFAANLPKPSLKEMDEVSTAYSASGMFLAVDPRDRKANSVVNYMDAANLDSFLTELQALANAALNHAAMYDSIAKEGEGLKFSYRHYYQKLVATPAQVTVQNSLVEFVHLKQDFVNKVYLPASMDIHDYVSTFLVYAVRFAKANVKALKP